MKVPQSNIHEAFIELRALSGSLSEAATFQAINPQYELPCETIEGWRKTVDEIAKLLAGEK